MTSGSPVVVPEYTSVTRRLRRVARFDIELVKMACRYNRPTSLAVMGLDRLEHANTGVTDIDKLTPRARNFLQELELATGIRVEFAGTGFGTSDSIRVATNVREVELSHV